MKVFISPITYIEYIVGAVTDLINHSLYKKTFSEISIAEYLPREQSQRK